MAQINTPRITFCNWIELSEYFENTSKYIQPRCPGIYLISKAKEQKGRCKTNDKKIIYIGMSTTSVKTRLRNLCNIVLKNQPAPHSGGKTIVEKFGNYKPGKGQWKKEKLYVSFSTPYGEVDPYSKNYSKFKKMGIVSYLEFKLIGRYYKKHGRTPVCNKDYLGE